MPLDLLPDRFTHVNGIKTRYWAAGDKGTAVVLIHGLGGFIETWSYNIRPMAQAHRVYAMDLLGFGQSDKTPLVRDFNMLVQFIHDFMKTLNIDKAGLIGSSLGGGLALQFALKYPEKVEKLVLADNAGMGREVASDLKWCSLPVLGALTVRPHRKNAKRLWEQIVYDSSVITQEFHDLSVNYASGKGAPEALLAALRAGINLRGQKEKLTRPLMDNLPAIKAPSLVVWGRQDRVIPLAHARVAAEKIPGARLEIFDRCGHIPMLEQPERFNKLVLEFLGAKSTLIPLHEGA